MAEEERRPVIDVPDFTEGGSEYDVSYRPSIAWDLEKGDFVKTSTNKVLRSDGLDAYRTWCVKMIATERYTCLAYSDDIGAEIENAAARPDRETIELALERTIEETLLVNPRTLSVENFVFAWGTDNVQVSFIVNATDEKPFTVDTVIKL